MALDHAGRQDREPLHAGRARAGDASGRPNRVPAEPRPLKGLVPGSTASRSRSGAIDAGLRVAPAGRRCTVKLAVTLVP